MKLQKIIRVLEDFAPTALQESYDNAGLLIGDPQWEISGAMLSLDCTEEVIAEAKKKKCNLVVSHHPLVFGGLKRITGTGPVERAVRLAIRNDIAIYASHTNLDHVRHGVNKRICDKLGLVNAKILKPLSGQLSKLVTYCPLAQSQKVRQAIFEAGAGCIGNYDECSFNLEGTGTFRGGENTNPYVGQKGRQHQEKEIRIETIFPTHLKKSILSALFSAHPYEEVAYDIYSLSNEWPAAGSGMTGEMVKPVDEKKFLEGLKTIFKVPVVRHTALLGKKIRKVAVCGGAGSFLLEHAKAAGADLFLSSDFKYHEFFNADGKILVADIGHFESEQFTPEIFYEVLKRNFPKFAVHFSSINTNPVKYT